MCRFLISFLIVIHSLNCYPNNDTIFNTINNKPLIIDSSLTDFSFFIAGHIYGQPSNSVHPSPSITSNIELFKKQNTDFVILLGDNYRHFDSINIANFKSDFLSKIKLPIFNSVGNHDIHNDLSFNNNNAYAKEFNTELYHSFSINSSLFIILNTEIHQVNNKSDGTISKKQLAFLKSVINTSSPFDNILLFSHKKLDAWETNNYSEVIKPILDSLSREDKAIYLFSGDKENSLSDLSYKKENNITFIHTYINDSKDDKILKIVISKSGIVKLQIISLYGLKTHHIEKYPELTVKINSESNSFFGKVIGKLTHKIFIQGAFFSFCLIYLFRKLVKTKKK